MSQFSETILGPSLSAPTLQPFSRSWSMACRQTSPAYPCQRHLYWTQLDGLSQCSRTPCIPTARDRLLSLLPQAVFLTISCAFPSLYTDIVWEARPVLLHASVSSFEASPARGVARTAGGSVHPPYSYVPIRSDCIMSKGGLFPPPLFALWHSAPWPIVFHLLCPDQGRFRQISCRSVLHRSATGCASPQIHLSEAGHANTPSF